LIQNVNPEIADLDQIDGEVAALGAYAILENLELEGFL
jgi:hypothetical protein